VFRLNLFHKSNFDISDDDLCSSLEEEDGISEEDSSYEDDETEEDNEVENYIY